MIPSGNNSFAPWLNPKEGDVVEILTEFKSSESPKLKGKLVADVSYGGKTYAISLSNMAYIEISQSQEFGADTKDWIGKGIRYNGLVKFNTSKNNGKYHSWSPVETEIQMN